MPFDETGKLRETTLVERIKIIEARATGDSYREIAAKFPVSKSQAQKITTEWTATDKITDDRRSGRPKILSARDKRDLNQLANEDPEATFSQITAASGLDVSEQTVADFLRSEGWYIHFARKKPGLKPRQKHNRKLWCAGRRQ